MKDYLFTINEKNAIDLKKDFGLNDYNTKYIYLNFHPIIVLTDISITEFKNKLELEKKKFVDERKKFVLDIFRRDYLDFLIYELKEYLDNIQRGKNKIYDKINNTYFHRFKLKDDEQSYTLLLSKNDITDLEIYFIDLLDCINFFIIKNEALPPQLINENETIRYTAKHYVLTYLIECISKGESFPIGQKKELEKIGNKIMGTGKGNRFYKVFNEIVNKDLKIENNLIEIGGENWRTIVKNLSNNPEEIETYLQSKQL